MAITKAARNKIFSLVQASKKLLIQEVESQLEQYYGIHTNGSIVDVDLLTSQEADRIYTARTLRQRLKYIQNNHLTEQHEITDAIRLLVSEEAFTILNRFASLRMAEERNIIKESVRKIYNSEGFLVFDSITGQGQTAEIFNRYTWYLSAVFDELAVDLPSLFERFSPHALIFPSEQALTRLLDILNNEDVTIHREDGMQPVNLWIEDETIGWIYQYYNSKDEIRQMREESDLPRNSRELAVRNQFFTPRYVVQFLTDNSLGRIWYEMTQGQTRLIDFCPYLIRRPNEYFLKKGEVKPENSNEDRVYIDYRKVKDPRHIKMLDPACGSMHFGLYAFDIFEQIYLEAWEKYPELLGDLRDKFIKADFINQIPELIIRHNIHGVDIDPRALQIAGLSLWFRAQKSFDRLQLQPENRPVITRSNLVLAEPMPGNEAMLKTLLAPLDQPMQQLVSSIWQKMQLAGETGLLLKIEQEITNEITRISKEWKEYHKKAQTKLGDTPEQIEKAKQAAKYNQAGYWQNFLETAEQQVLDILEDLASKATNGEAYQALLFAEDTQRGFAFIELCRQQYDVVLMNPPFGASPKLTEKYYDDNYSTWAKNILVCFIIRMKELLDENGFVALIYDRTVHQRTSYKNFRINYLCGDIFTLFDSGWNVLDANVETTTSILTKFKSNKDGFFIDFRDVIDKESSLVDYFKYRTNYQDITYIKNSYFFKELPDAIIGYYFNSHLIDLFKNNHNLEKMNIGAKTGHSLNPEQHYRHFWESTSKKDLIFLYNGGEFSMFYMPYRQLAHYG